MHNKQTIIIFVVSIKTIFMINKEKAKLRKDLNFYLDYYNKVSDRMKEVFDREIQEIIEQLKKLGKK